jgi:hypothetical protein
LRNLLEAAHVISKSQLEDIAATRAKPLAPGATARTMPVELGRCRFRLG